MSDDRDTIEAEDGMHVHLDSGQELKLRVASEEVVEDVAYRAAIRVAHALELTQRQLAEFEAIGVGDDIPPEKQTFSVGECCKHVGCGPDRLRGLMRCKGILFVGAHNGIPYLDGTRLAVLSELQAEILEYQKQQEAEA